MRKEGEPGGGFRVRQEEEGKGTCSSTGNLIGQWPRKSPGVGVVFRSLLFSVLVFLSLARNSCDTPFRSARVFIALVGLAFHEKSEYRNAYPLVNACEYIYYQLV